MGLTIIAPILPLYSKIFAATGIEIGLVFTAFSVSRATLGPFVGRLSDRIGRKPLIMAGLAGCAIVSVLYAFVDSLWQLAVLRLLHGAASILITPSAQAYVGDLIPKGREGRYMNAFSASQFIGMAIGPLLGGGIGAIWSYDAAFCVMAGLSATALLVVGVAVPDDGTSRARRSGLQKASLPFRRVVANDAVKAMLAYYLTRGFWRQSFDTFYPLYAVTLLGVDEARVGLILSTYMFAEGLLQVPFGFLADRFPRVRQIVIGSLFAPLMLFVIPHMKMLWGVLAFTFCMGAFSALGRSSFAAIRTEIGRTHGMATVAGLQSSSFSAGRVFGPIVSGAIVDNVGLLAVFPLGGAVGILGTCFVVAWIRRWLRNDPNSSTTASPME